MRKTNALTLIILAAILTINLPATIFAASPGALDPSFGKGGKVFTTNNGFVFSGSGTVQPDGKIIVVTDLNSDGTAEDDFLIIRYNSNGTLDTTFGGDGKVTADFGGGRDEARGVAVQPDGKIVVVGDGSNQISQFCALARYLPNGALDTTFSGDGKFLVDVSSTSFFEFLRSVAIQSDGKIVAAGSANISSNQDFLLLRLTVAGTLDTTFSSDGIATAGLGGSDEARDVAIQPDSKIVAGGSGTSSGFSNVKSAAARYNANGSLDTSFDTDGKFLFNVSAITGSNFAVAVAIESGGKIILAGIVIVTGDRKPLVLRLNANGSLDTSFGNGGIVITDGVDDDFIALEGTLYGDKFILFGNDFGITTNILRYNLLPTPSQTGDFDGDGFTDSTVYRPSSATWFTLRSADNTVSIEQFGLNGDIPMDGDFDGDGRADLCIYRPSSGIWFSKRSSNGTTFGAQFGQAGDKPQSGDFDKDGKSDVSIWRPSNGNYFVLRSSSGFSTLFGYPFGTNGDIPVQTGAQ